MCISRSVKQLYSQQLHEWNPIKIFTWSTYIVIFPLIFEDHKVRLKCFMSGGNIEKFVETTKKLG